MATQTNKHALLERAIDNANEHILRDLLKSLCRDSEACRKEATDRLLVSRKHEIIELSDSSDDDTKKQSKKRKKVEVIQKPRYEECETCGETYDITLNDDEACQTHNGALLISPPLLAQRCRS